MMTPEEFGCIVTGTAICAAALLVGGTILAVAWIGDWLLTREERDTRD